MIDLKYPVYVLPYRMGYVSVVDTSNSSDPPHQLVVCSKLGQARQLMRQYDLEGNPRAIHNDREFAWLLESLREPVTMVTFDPELTDDTMNSVWNVSVQTLLVKHLSSDLFIWNYPIFVIAIENGFAGVNGTNETEEQFVALDVFTSAAKAEQFKSDSSQMGTLCKLNDLNEALCFFEGMQTTIDAVVIDPVIDGGKHTAEQCLRIDILLSKYLISRSDGRSAELSDN